MSNRVLSPLPTHSDESLLPTLKQELLARKDQRERLDKVMRDFTHRLFDAFEDGIRKASELGAPNFGKPRRIAHPAGDWRQALQIYIEDWSVIFVPLVGFAWPNPRDEAKIHAVRFKEPCGRIAAFWADEPGETSFYDFLVFSDGSWFAWGYGWPRNEDNIDSTDFEHMTLEILVSFVRDIHATWRPRGDTALSQSLDGKKRAYRFGRPGEE